MIYVPFHVHSMLSNGTTNVDSVTNFRLFVDKAKECGIKAFGFSEHGNVFEWLHKKEYIEKAGMKYIHAVEVYITETLQEKLRDNYHCVLIAKNYDGFLEINQLVSKSFNRAEVKVVDDNARFYYMPRITYEELENTSDNVIITTACLGGILFKGNDEIRNQFICFLYRNKHRCYLEIQHHNDAKGLQKKHNQYLWMLSKEIGVPLIAGTDTHSLNDEHAEGRLVLQKSKNVNFDDEESLDLRFKTPHELVEAYEIQNALPKEVYINAINETNKMADKIEEFVIDRSYKYPHLWEDSMGTFRRKIAEGIKKRGVDRYPNYQEYLDRIEYEIEAYVHNQAIDFMLLMEDIIDWCNTQDIKVGYGRGSVNGSVIAWLLGITEMDSIKHKLNYDRFMNTSRVSLSDIDTDFPPSRVDEVKDYIFSKHGLYCCDIVTFNTVADKGAIRDVGRALNIPLTIVADICSAVDNEDEYNKVRKQFPELFKYVDLIKGTIVSVGSHPCGLVCAPFSVTDRFGTFTTSTSNYPISQINMKEIDSLNYVKLDLLRLDTIELINETCKLAGIERLTPDNVDITDVRVWNEIRDDTTQIFQWEGNTGDSYIKKLLSDDNIRKFQAVNENIDRMTLLSIGNSAIRPAGASYRDDLANGVVRLTGSKPIDEFLSNTFGYLVFQCQIIEFLHVYCGFTMGEADIVRRGFAKKTGTDKYIPIIKDGGYMTDKQDHYIKGFIKTMKETYGIDEHKSEEDIVAFIKVIEDASSYLFSLNHSQPYSYEGYVSGYLRTYHPVEFLTVAMNINRDKEDKTRALTQYAKKRKIIIKPPRFRYSQAGYFPDRANNAIYKGIDSIKYMNEQVATELYELRDVQYCNFIDLLIDLESKTTLNSRQLDILIKIDFFEEFGDINRLLLTRDVYNMFEGRKTFSKKDMIEKQIPELILRRNSQNETETRVEEIAYEEFLRYRGLYNIEAELSDCMKYKYVVNAAGSKEKIPNGVSYTKLFKKYNPTPDELNMFATKIVYGRFDGLNVRQIVKDLVQISNIDPCRLDERIKYQLEHLGYVEYINPKASSRYVAVVELDDRYSPKFKAYCLKTGDMCEMRVHKRKNPREGKVATCFSDEPFKDGDILYMGKCVRKPKQRKNADGDWMEVPNEFNWWLTEYKKVSLVS